MAPPSDVAAPELPFVLRDFGRRSFRRFVPVAEVPATITLHGESGWVFADRRVANISAGGLSFGLDFWASRSVRVGDAVQMVLTLVDQRVRLDGRCVHMSGPQDWRVPRAVGIGFSFDQAYEDASPALVAYLLRLRKAEDPPVR